MSRTEQGESRLPDVIYGLHDRPLASQAFLAAFQHVGLTAILMNLLVPRADG